MTTPKQDIDASTLREEGATERAMKAAVVMEVHSACSTRTDAKAAELDRHFPGYDDMLAALKAMDAFWSEDVPGPESLQAQRFDDDCLSVWRGMRAAIAKATKP